jgi:hypothetical protein
MSGTSSLPSGTSAHPQGAERRRSSRYPPRPETRGQLIADESGDSWPVALRNVSAHGVSLVFGRRLELESSLTLKLDDAEGTFSARLPIRVVYAIQQQGEEVILGCAFGRDLTPDEVQGLLPL